MLHINQIIENAVRKYWEELALTDFNGISLQYRDIARKVAKLHLLFEQAGIVEGDKIALCGKNSTQWSVAFIAALTYGAVPVPILHEFKPDSVHHILNHSDSRILFTDVHIFEHLDVDKTPQIDGVFDISDYSLLFSKQESINYARAHLNELFGKRYPERFTREDVIYKKPDMEQLAIINYTSGSTGLSKGVMIPYRAISSNIDFALTKLSFLGPGDKTICMLPLAHMLGLSIELLHPLSKGCHVFFLTRIPSPKIIMDAFASTRPRLIVTVPLILEKIIKTKVFPLLEKPYMKLLLTVPFVNDRLLGKIKERLTETFGGQLFEIIIGGAALNADVERFLRRIGFPYTVGYGMTECAPLISYAGHEINRPGACGLPVSNIEIKVDSPDPENIAGELLVHGSNVMLGYYKNPQETADALRDGWLHTGDICNVDSDGFIYIRGRNKNLILGPSGQNIYPEEIEQQLNNMPYVNESLIVDRQQHLVALIHPDYETAAQQGIEADKLPDIMKENIVLLNKDLPAYSQIADFEIMEQEFEKTPKRSIRRFLYK
ncbi:MAG TPA: AMP-binding protein [Candidatus Limisoma intestinavium]|uniref:AMP-binding protein n=1 Tax=Candidatus Limisoma intestinavium TaxID=2840856 RepID=A0A9D1IKU6_9BACT|nr:AMP-binding protein [Candidatus Limisoma intestinavium]